MNMKRHTVFLAAAVVVAVLSPSAAREIMGAGKLRMYFFNVGQGDAILIRTPHGEDIVIDGGPDRTALAKLGDTLPFFDRTIELAVVTHPHADHVAGLLEISKRYGIREVWESGFSAGNDLEDAWNEHLRTRNISARVVRAGEVVERDGVRLEVLAPFPGNESNNPNDASVVIRLVYGETEVLLTGDATGAVEERLLAAWGEELDADILKVGHHGSRDGSSREFLRAVSPETAIISVGENRYGHPAFRTVKHLEEAGAALYRTDQDGDVEFWSDGKRFWKH